MQRQAILLILRGLSSEDGKGLKTVMIVFASILLAVILLIAAIIGILTMPFALAGDLGKFQEEYAYLVAVDTEEFAEPLSDDQIEEAVMAAETGDAARQDILRTGLSLVGKVPYFWGGKSGPGWNEDWNKPRIVTSPGSDSTGSIRPYGLDCSGYAQWVWSTAGYPFLHSALADLTEDTVLQPGDLVYTPDHVGIYYGVGEDGERLYLHCSAGAGGVALNGYDGWTSYRHSIFASGEG